MKSIFVSLVVLLAACAQTRVPFHLNPEDLSQIKSKTASLESLIQQLKSKHADPDMVGDVEVYAKAGVILQEFPDQIFTQKHVEHALAILDAGSDRAKELLDGKPSWTKTRKQVHAFYSTIDGSVQPYGVTLPENYDPSKPTRLYVWLHGRQNQTTESEFLFAFPNGGPGKPPVAEIGQIQVDVYGRLNSAGYHWAGEADIFEAIAAVQKRFKIDDKRILLRGFSMGGEGAWHIALHYPDRFVAAEIGAGTISRRAEVFPDMPAYQRATLNIWENMPEWALNIFNLPLAGHDGDADTQTCCLPPVAPGTPNHGQLDSSLRTRAQLEKEGFASEGDPDFLHSKGTPGIFLISQKTGHGTSPLVRERLDAFLKEWGDKGQTSPDHLRFVTWTTRYNRDYWLSVDGLAKTYDRADVDATRNAGQYKITTTNVTRITLRETNAAKSIDIDNQSLPVHPEPQITLERAGNTWKVAKRDWAGLHKTHALQGPIDDAFLNPFLLVRPTGAPWNDGVNQQALRSLARFQTLWARYFRGHAFVKDDKDVTADDVARYHLVLFGDPGSNSWIGKVSPKLPVKWSKQTVIVGGQSFPAKDNYPAMIYPNPLNLSKYVVLNTGLTITEREYNGDYGMPQWGDYAIVTVKDGSDMPDLKLAGLFDEGWRVALSGAAKH
jgi:pimeloyl-ACP methyl ester carboxylesterase